MAFALSHVSGSRSGRVDRFSRESILIGRGSANDCALDPFLDPTVSAHHAEIRLERGRFVLYDMGSLNGTFVNGRSVRRCELEIGDEIGLGRSGPRLVFNARAPDGPPVPEERAVRISDVTPRTSMELIPAPAHILSQPVLFWTAIVLAIFIGVALAKVVLK